MTSMSRLLQDNSCGTNSCGNASNIHKVMTLCANCQNYDRISNDFNATFTSLAPWEKKSDGK